MNTNNHEEIEDVYHLDVFLAGFLFLGGLLLGSLTGAGAMLLLAPQSGKKTRRQMRRKGQKVRKQTAVTLHSGVNQIKDKTHQVTTRIQDQAEELQQHGQDVVEDQKERWGPVVEAGITAVQGT
ncbi:MAG: YtxH domain-containing protein [Anaerolineae bacterium]|nr:YtxH domain-containing protein [Anaerolineae bacterium]